MKTKEEIRIEFYGEHDARAYDHDELYIMEQYAKEYHEQQVNLLNKPAVMPSFVLDELRERAKVYQDNYYAVGLDEVERNEWYASWKAMEEAIYIIEHPSKTNEA